MNLAQTLPARAYLLAYDLQKEKASVVPLRTVFERHRKRHDRERVDDLVERVSADIPGFERLIGQMRHTRGRAYSAGGPVH